MEHDHRIALGETRPVHVRVSNDGTVAWPAGVESWPEIRLSYHWLAPDGTVVVHDGLRTPLPETVEPGRSTIVPAVVSAPQDPGEHVLALDLVHEHVRWFGCETRIAMAVEGEAEAPRRWSRRRR